MQYVQQQREWHVGSLPGQVQQQYVPQQPPRVSCAGHPSAVCQRARQARRCVFPADAGAGAARHRMPLAASLCCITTAANLPHPAPPHLLPAVAGSCCRAPAAETAWPGQHRAAAARCMRRLGAWAWSSSRGSGRRSHLEGCTRRSSSVCWCKAAGGGWTCARSGADAGAPVQRAVAGAAPRRHPSRPAQAGHCH